MKDKPGLDINNVSTLIFIALLLFSVVMVIPETVNAIDVYESDDTSITSTQIPTDGTLQSHDFHIAGDSDWVNFPAVSGTIYTIETLNLGVLCDTKITLYQSDGLTVITSDNNSGLDNASRIVWDSTEYPAGYYYVKIEDVTNNSGSEYTYDIRIFSGSPALLEPMYSDFGLDTDKLGDGYFNYLVIKVNLQVIIPGWYILNGSLYDDSDWLTSASNRTYINAGQQFIHLYFNGSRVYINGIDKSFDVFFYLFDDYGAFLENDNYTTGFYQYILFQPPDASFNPSHSDFGLDTDGDTIYNYLIVNAAINVTKAGWYELEGNLYGDSGWIAGNTNYTYLDTGLKFVHLYFNGTRIYTNRINEAFKVFFYLGDDFGTFQDDDSYTTDFYKYVKFQPPYASFQTPHSDFPLDTNGDSIYDYLVVNASVSVTKAGWYDLEGNFYSESGWLASKSNYSFLDAGSQQIQLYFDETHLYNNKMKEIFIVHFYLYDDTKTYLDYGNYTTDLGSGVLDVVAPWIIATTPMDGAEGINISIETITIEFSELMNRSSVKSAFSINPAKYIQNYTWEGNVLKLSLSSKLVKGGKYTVTIGRGAKDKAGNTLEEPYKWSFTVESDAKEEEEAEYGGFLLMLFVIPVVILILVAQLISYLKKKKRKSADLLKEEQEEKKKYQKTRLKNQTRYERRNL